MEERSENQEWRIGNDKRRKDEEEGEERRGGTLLM